MSEIQVNTINEYTGANGVTIDSFQVKDGGILAASGVPLQVVTYMNNITAHNTITATSFTDIEQSSGTKLEIKITPKQSDSKIILIGQAATYHEDNDQFSLTPEQAAIFAHEGEPTCMQGLFQGIVAQYATHDVALDVFKTGRGRPWEEHHECCFCGTDRFFRPIYVTNLLENWIPSLDGVKEKLETGANVADIGCGLGSSSILMAKTFPNSKIYGYDFHEPSIIKAREKAEIEGVDNIEFAVSDAKNIPGKGYDFACIFDALHDMGDPVGVSKAILNTLNDDGTFMLVEPFANDELKDNLNSQSGLYYSFSTLICVPTSRAQEVGLQLGAQAGEKRLRSVLNEAGFENIERRCLDIESNIVLEAKA